MKLSPEDKAKEFLKRHDFYWRDSELMKKQRIELEIAEIIRVLRSYGIEDFDYWNEVSKKVYEI